MKEKRYFCDWASEESEQNVNKKPIFISLFVVTAICSLFYFNIFRSDFVRDLELYDQSDKYLEEIADNVIGKDGINVVKIPDDVEYEISDRNNEIVFTYDLESSKEREFTNGLGMSITLSKNGKVLSKEPNYSSKNEYIRTRTCGYIILIPLLGALTWGGISVSCVILMGFAVIISMIHKKIDMEKNLS
mgnify:FL=1